jgi:hypothetical protein
MKTIILFLLIFSIKLNAQQLTQQLSFEAKVTSYAKIDANLTPTLVDTIAGQKRIISLAKDGSLFELGFQIDSSIIKVEYYIEKIYKTTNYNQTTGKSNTEFMNYLAFDSENYPMLLLVSLDQTTAYLYYYWNNDENTFKKSEKLALTVINDDILFPVEE